MSLYYQMFVQKLDSYINNNKNPIVPYLETAEKKTGVKRTYLVQAALGVLSLYLIVGKFAQFLCNAIGFVFPAYKSLVALESSNKEDDTKWLTYWVVFAAFSVVEFFSDTLLSWFPLYWLAKLVFLIWCSMDIPNNGSAVIYNRFIRPVFLKYGKRVTSANGKNASGSSSSNNNNSNNKDN